MATAAASAFTAGLSSGGMASAATAASILSGTTQALGALQRGEAAEARAASLQDQAELAEIRAEQETTRGRQRANSIRSELVRNIAANQAAAGASGLAMSSGSIQTSLDAALREGSREIRLTQRNAGQRSQARRMRAFRLRREAGLTREAGEVNERLGLLRAFSGVASRGITPGGGGSSGGSPGVGGSIPNNLLQAGTG